MREKLSRKITVVNKKFEITPLAGVANDKIPAAMIEKEIDLASTLSVLPTDSDYVVARLLIDDRNELGEGIIYDERKQTLFWTDILGKKFHSLQLNYENSTRAIYRTYGPFPKMLCSFGLLETDPTTSELPLLCAWEDGFQLYDIAKLQPLSDMSQGEAVNPNQLPSRLNDGRVAPEGSRYICGGYYGDVPGIKMKVFRVEQSKNGSLTHHAIVDEIEVTNSICFGLDGKTMYLADSPTKTIYSYDYNQLTGTISKKKHCHKKLETDQGVPDGSCVDSDGFLWNAVWKAGVSASNVQRIDPNNGSVVYTVHMPDKTSQVTCCCFGGKDLDILFISTAAESRDLDKEPHAGGLYAIKVPFKGRKENRLTFTLPSKNKYH